MPIFNTRNRCSCRPRQEAGETGDPRTLDLESIDSWLAILEGLSRQGSSQEDTGGDCRNKPGEGHDVPFHYLCTHRSTTGWVRTENCDVPVTRVLKWRGRLEGLPGTAGAVEKLAPGGSSARWLGPRCRDAMRDRARMESWQQSLCLCSRSIIFVIKARVAHPYTCFPSQKSPRNAPPEIGSLAATRRSFSTSIRFHPAVGPRFSKKNPDERISG